MDFEQRLRAYAASRSGMISQHEADLIVSRSLSGGDNRSVWSRHGLNAAAALALSLVILVGGILLGTELRNLRLGTTPSPTPGPLPAVPDEVVNLDNFAQSTSEVTPFRLRDRKILPPQLRWIVTPGKGLMIDSGSLCDVTLIHIVDFGSPPRDTQPPVSLPGCYRSPTLVPNSTLILLSHGRSVNGVSQDLGIVAYDWSAGRVVRSYPNLSLGISGGIVSPDGQMLYSSDVFSQNPSVTIANLTSGDRVASIATQPFGLTAGGLALSADGRTLYLNEGIRLRTFDARTGREGAVFDFKNTKTSPTAMLPAWLWSWLPKPLDADAKEGLEAGYGVAVDPRGRWVAALGEDGNIEAQGVWIFGARDGRLVRHFPATLTGDQFRGVAFSLDGSVLFALRSNASGAELDMVDPQSGRSLTLKDARFSDLPGIAGVAPAH